MYDSLRNCRVFDERREPVSDHRVGLLPGVPCRLLILVRPEMRGAVHDAIDQYGWALKHQHVAVALEFEAQVMEAVGALLSRAQLLQRRAHGGMNGGVQLFQASL